MANIKAAKKDIIRNKRNKDRNLTFKSKMKSAIKNTKDAILTNASDKEELLKTTLRIIDKTAAKGIIKKQTAATKKSKLSILFNNGPTEAKKKKTSKKKVNSTSKSSKKDTEATTK